MNRRGFEHLLAEISVAVGRAVPRYELWVRLRELGENPEQLSREAALRFCDEHLHEYLEDMGLALASRAERRLRRSVRVFDPRHPTPAETLARLARIAR